MKNFLRTIMIVSLLSSCGGVIEDGNGNTTTTFSQNVTAVGTALLLVGLGVGLASNIASDED